MSDAASPPQEDPSELRARLQRAEVRLRDTEAELSAARSALRHRDAQLEELETPTVEDVEAEPAPAQAGASRASPAPAPGDRHPRPGPELSELRGRAAPR